MVSNPLWEFLATDVTPVMTMAEVLAVYALAAFCSLYVTWVTRLVDAMAEEYDQHRARAGREG